MCDCCQAVGAVTRDGVFKSKVDQGQAVQDGFCKDDLFVGLGRLAVEQTFPAAGKIQVAGSLGHAVNAAAIHPCRVPVKIVEREHGTAVKMLFAVGVQDAQIF